MSSEDFIEIMDELGRRIEGPAQQVYELAIRQVYVGAGFAVVLFAISMWLAVKLVGLAYRKKQELRAEFAEASKGNKGYTSRLDYDLMDREPALLSAAALATGFAFFTTINLLVALPGVFNPSWAALRLILGSIT